MFAENWLSFPISTPGPTHTHTHTEHVLESNTQCKSRKSVVLFLRQLFSRSLSLSHTLLWRRSRVFFRNRERERESAYLDCVFVCGLWPPGRLSTSGQAKARLSQNESVWSVGFSFGEPAPVRSLLDGNSDGRSGVTNRHLSVFLCVCEEGGCAAEEWVWMWCGPSPPGECSVWKQ